MTEQDIKNTLVRIKDSAWDYEAAHAIEDDLYSSAIQHVADGGTLTMEMAELILTSQKIKFPRYTA